MKAGGGCVMTIGSMTRTCLTKLEWFSTLFPRIPVPIQKEIDEGLLVSDYDVSSTINTLCSGIILGGVHLQTNNKIFIYCLLRRLTRLSWMTRVLPQRTVATQNT